MKIRSAAMSLFLIVLVSSVYAASQNYTITLFDHQNGAGNRVMTYTGPMLTNSQLNGTSFSGFVLNPAAMNWSSPPISADSQQTSFLPCSAYPDPGTGGPNGEANITCFSAAPGTTNGVPLFSFCFQGGSWPLSPGTYNVDSPNAGSCGNYFVAYSQNGAYAYDSVNSGSIVVVKNTTAVVTSLADDGSAGTLRSLIGSVNSGDTITFAVTGTISLLQGTLEISKNLTISGPGAGNLTISGNHNSTVFQIDSGAAVNISAVTIQDGTGNNNGGDIDNEGLLTLSDCSMLPGTASNGGEIYNAGTANVARCNFTGNPNGGTAGYGGGIYNGGTLSVVGSTFSNFNVGGGGTAIFNAGYFQSAAGNGTVTNSTFWQNSGAVIFDAGTSSNLTVINSTFAGNGGSAVYSLYGGTTLKNTLLANSGVSNCSVSNGPMKSGGYNLSTDNSCSSFFTQTGDLNNATAGLDSGGLKNNGGPTQTIAILPTSPAFNVIPLSPTNYCTDASGSPLTTDQRGVSRPQVSACDIGAFEYSNDDDSGLAQLNGGNSFAGNQTVSGSIDATNFVGNGSGLTGVNAATATTASVLNCAGCVGNTQLGITYAGGDAQGGNALNALALGGLPVSAFAPAMGSPVYAPATGSAAYVAKGGDTMTGTLNLPTDGLVAGGNEFVLTSGNVGVGTTTPENLPQYRSLQIDYSGAGFGGAFLELTHSTNGQKGRLVMDDHGFLLNAVSSAPIKIKAGSTFNGGSDPGNIYIAPSGNVGINTGTPAAALDVNGTANFSGLVTFAPGQTFPGSGGGTITGVTAGTGLSGGGTSGNVALTNTGLLSLAATNGILSSGGQNPTLSLNTSFTDSRYLQLAGGTLAGNLSAPAFVGSGAGLTNLNPANLSSGTANINITGLAASATNAFNLGGSPASSFATTGANTFSGTQTVNGDGNISGTLNLNGAFVSGLSGGLWTTGVRLNSTGVSTSSRGFPSGPLQFWASSFSTNTNGPWIQGFQWLAEPVANDTANPSATLNLQFINGPMLPPPPSGFTMQETGFSVSPQGAITIGGGNPIIRHTSTLFQNIAFNTKVSPATCTVWSGSMANLFDGDSVVVTLGSSLMTANIVYSAWATNGAVQVRICNPTGAPTTIGAGNIRVDVWRH